MNEKLESRNVTYIYLALQTALYVSFLYLDLTDTNLSFSCKIKFMIIILCFCYVLLYKKSTDRSILLCLRTALFFTVISDLFLLLLDYYFYGVLTFIIVQQLHGIRLDLVKEKYNGRIDEKLPVKTFLLRLSLQAIFTVLLCILLADFGVIPEKLLVITVFYFISIVTNVVRSVIAALRDANNKSNLIFAAGMVLFLLCDISVGLFNLSDFISLSGSLYQLLFRLSTILMWFFYAPSQVLISLSISKQGSLNKN